MLVYSRVQPFDPELAKRQHEEYLERARATDFRRSRDLPRYFARDFFNDGKFARFEYDPHQNTLLLQMESVLTLNDVYDLRASMGMPREMPHQCEDFSYNCTFRGVAYLQVRQAPMQRTDAEGNTVAHALPRGGVPDDYQHGEILDSPLLCELEAELGVLLFHLRFETGWAKQVDVIFEKVVVRKLNDVKYESYTGGKRVRLSHVFRG
jgi:hypothetical protein